MYLTRLFFYAFAMFFLPSKLLFGVSPSVTNISPILGPKSGGTVVNITGSNFTGATAVKFGPTSAAFIVNSDNSITATAPASVPGTVNIIVTTPSGTSASTLSDLYTYQGPWFAYVSNRNSGTVTPINIDTNTAGAPIVIGGNPTSVAITPDGRTAYVMKPSNNQVVPIDLVTDTPGAPIPTGGFFSQDIAITPDGTLAYVTNTTSATLTPINLATNTPGVPFAVPPGPVTIAITPDGKKAYLLNNTANNVTPVDLTTSTPGPTINGISTPGNLAITPDGKTVYVPSILTGRITLIDVATDTISFSFFLIPTPQTVAITSDNLTAFVTNNVANTLTPIDIATNTPGTPTAVPNAFGLAITPDNTAVYVTNINSVERVNATTGVVESSIPVGLNPLALAITPDQAPRALFMATVNTVGLITSFDASASLSPTGTIALYQWDFGDSQTATTTSPVITHTYTSAGTFNVTLTVTNSGGTSTTQTFTGKTVSNQGGPLATTTQIINISQLSPPSNFTGVIKKNRFLNRTELVLKMKWDASTAPDIVFYRIFLDNKIVAEIPAGSPLIFKTCVPSRHSASQYEIAAVNSSNLESRHIMIRII